MAVFAAVISYILQMTSFVLLRQKLPNIERPYRSKWGVPGAGDRRAAGATSLVAIFLNDAYRPGVYGVAIYYVLGVLYFAIAGRNRLVLSPEEEFALTQGEHGIPQGGGIHHLARGAGGDPRRRSAEGYQRSAQRSKRTADAAAIGDAHRLADRERVGTNGGPVLGPAVRV
jgi:ethanolamine permease